MDVQIDSIVIGERIRKDYGDLQPLAESMKELGLLHPIGITPEQMLVFGERRLRAARDILRWEKIPARIVNIESIVLGEHAENELRKDFTVSERVAIGKLLEEILGKRQGQRTDLGLGQNFGEVKPGQRTSEAAAKKAGFGNDETYRQAKEVIEKATSDLVRAMDQELIPVSRAAALMDASPEFQQAVVKKLEQDIKPTEAIRQVKAETIRQKEAVMPSGKYRVLYADPPWSYGNTQPDYHTEQRDHYPVMSIQEICDLGKTEGRFIKDIAEDNAVLFLWVTSPILEESFEVVRAWGFEYRASFVWDKVKHNMGHYNSVRHELLLVCIRGSCQPDVRKLFDSVVTEERTEHSRKPAVFYEMIETIYPHGKRIELFARQSRAGWDSYGNQ